MEPITGISVDNTTGTVTAYGITGTITTGTDIGTSLTTSVGNVSLGCTNPSSILTLSNPNNMNRQVKVAVFEVSRNEDNKVVSSKLVKELWVEQKNGSSIELAVAKHLDKDFNPETTIIKETYSVSF